MKSFDSLYAELLELQKTLPEASGTTKLLEGGVHAIGKKLVEEAAEVWMAAEHESDDQLAIEVSQLLYYAQLMLVARNVPLTAVEKVL
jgi:phosphoribosyl-ATP pyrophosphohydrolase